MKYFNMIRIKSLEFYNDEVFGNKYFDFTVKNKSCSSVILLGLDNIDAMHLLRFFRDKFDKTVYTKRREGTIYCIINLDVTTERIFGGDNKIDIAKIICKKNNNKNNILEVEYYSNSLLVRHAYKRINGEVYDYNINLRNIYMKMYNYNDLDNKISDILCLYKDINNKHITRFNKGLLMMFNMKYIGLINKIPMFSRYDKVFSISKLSEEEKQIIYEGLYLLKNENIFKGFPIFINDYMNSSCDNINSRIYDYFRALFDNKTQIFIFTRSRAIVQRVIREDNSLIYRMDDDKKFSKVDNCFILDPINVNEVEYHIFGIPSVKYHNKLYNYYRKEVCTFCHTLKRFDDHLVTVYTPVKSYSYIGNTGLIHEYNSLCTYIRNCTVKPDEKHYYNIYELREAIEFIYNTIIKDRNGTLSYRWI